MAPRVLTAGRKTPIQARSKAMVEALLGATARVLVKDGYDALSTNKVAVAAGVSVGSLYQYFPSKEALIRAVMDRWVERMEADMVELASALAEATLEDGVPVMVKASLDLHRNAPKLHRALLQQVPRVNALDGLVQLSRRLVDLLDAWLSARREQLGVGDPAMAAHVVVHLLSALTDHAVLYRPELLASPGFEAHLNRVVLNYLRKDGAARTRPAGRRRLSS
jgi:AcrR family transcriptional regulator